MSRKGVFQAGCYGCTIGLSDPASHRLGGGCLEKEPGVVLPDLVDKDCVFAPEPEVDETHEAFERKQFQFIRNARLLRGRRGK